MHVPLSSNASFTAFKLRQCDPVGTIGYPPGYCFPFSLFFVYFKIWANPRPLPSFVFMNLKNRGWCAWDSNQVRWIVGADETADALISYLIFVSRTDKVATLPSTVSPAKPRPDCSWPVKAEVILSKYC